MDRVMAMRTTLGRLASLSVVCLFGSTELVSAATQVVSAPPPAVAVDLAKADRAVVIARIAALDAERADAQRALAEADAALDVAESDLRDAERSEAASRRLTVRRDRDARQAAVDAYVSEDPQTARLTGLLSNDAQELTDRSTFLEVRVARRTEVLSRQQAAQRALEQATKLTRDKTSAADAAAQASQRRVAELDARVADLATLVTALDQRVEAALAEAAAIAELDRAAAVQLVSDESALRDAAQAQVAGATSSRPRSRRPTGKQPPASSRAVPSTTAPPLTAPGPTAAPVPLPQPVVAGPSVPNTPTTMPSSGPTTVPTTYVPPPAPPTTVINGIRVHTSIASQLGALMDAADAAGLTLAGSGYRDPAAQIDLRRRHCGPTDYDIWFKPASQCSPPTARPGQSLHEQGLAVDLTCAGRLITASTSPCFVWLSANARTFGFFNLASEPWHWSTTGN